MQKLIAMSVVGLMSAQAAWAGINTEGFETSLALGVTINQGNTDSSLGNLALATVNSSEDREIRAGADFVYGEEDGDKNAENARAFAEWKESLSERTYTTYNVSGMYDPIADVDYRAILSIGLGYYAMKSEAATLALDVGPAYVWEKVGGETDDYLAIRFAERYDRALSETAKVWQSLEYIPEAEDFDNYLLIGEIGVEAALNARMSLRTLFRVTYDSEPAEGAKKSDRQLLAGLVVNL